MWWHNKDGLKPGDFTEEGERVYQAIKKRLMDELVVGEPYVNLDLPPTPTNLVLIDREKPDGK